MTRPRGTFYGPPQSISITDPNGVGTWWQAGNGRKMYVSIGPGAAPGRPVIEFLPQRPGRSIRHELHNGHKVGEGDVRELDSGCRYGKIKVDAGELTTELNFSAGDAELWLGRLRIVVY